MKITRKSQIGTRLPEQKQNRFTNAHCYYFYPNFAKPPVVRSPFFSVCYNVGLCLTAECCLCVGTRQALLQGWLLCVGFVCLANVPDLVRRLGLLLLESYFKVSINCFEFSICKKILSVLKHKEVS